MFHSDWLRKTRKSKPVEPPLPKALGKVPTNAVVIATPKVSVPAIRTKRQRTSNPKEN